MSKKRLGRGRVPEQELGSRLVDAYRGRGHKSPHKGGEAAGSFFVDVGSP